MNRNEELRKAKEQLEETYIEVVRRAHAAVFAKDESEVEIGFNLKDGESEDEAMLRLTRSQATLASLLADALWHAPEPESEENGKVEVPVSILRAWHSALSGGGTFETLVSQSSGVREGVAEWIEEAGEEV